MTINKTPKKRSKKNISKKMRPKEKDNSLSPLNKEIARYILLDNLKKELKTPPTKYKKLDINNILPRWLMLNISNNNKKDPLIPFSSRKINNKQFIKDILFNYPSIQKDEITTIINHYDLIKHCKTILKQLSVVENNIKDHITYYEKTRSAGGAGAYGAAIKEFKIIVSSGTTTEYKIPTLKIPLALYNKIKIPNQEQKEEFIITLLLRYEELSSNNQQLANNPRFYENIRKKYGFNFELFASGLNHYYDAFCSLYPDLEESLGSKGSFNDYNLLSLSAPELYVANPPFDEEICIIMVDKIIAALDSKKALTFLITIPSKWENFEALEQIKKSDYLTFMKEIPKRKALYYNYNTAKYIYPTDVVFLLLQNESGASKYNFIDALNKDIGKFYFS